ncbi:hypothetical protein C8R47DRAFT_302483 [Mycena vitilis]|nr:hypothetical protein C8R47DRAFT_302483 [Mycena vitilis]
MEAQYTVNSTVLNTYWDEIEVNIAATWVAVFFYACYLNLFIWALYTLTRRKTAGKRVLLGFTWTMAILSTTQIVLTLTTSTMTVRSLPQFIEQGHADLIFSRPYIELHVVVQGAILGINNLVADALLLYRCYMIWGAQWKVAVAPAAVLMVATFILGCVAMVPSLYYHPFLQRSPYILATVTNIVLMLLTAGRIWWIRRATLRFSTDFNDTIRDRYSSIIAMILESGALYCVLSILLSSTFGTPFIPIQAAGMHLINIVPTIIIVRVGLGSATQDPAGPEIRRISTTTRPQPLGLSRLPAGQKINSSSPQSSAVLHIKPDEGELDF